MESDAGSAAVEPFLPEGPEAHTSPYVVKWTWG